MLRLPEVVDIIRVKIHSGEYGPGSRLPAERALSDELGVSRRTLRKALQLLEEEHYVRARSGTGRGWYVSDLSVVAQRWKAGFEENPRPFDHQLDFRMAIETGAVTLAALRRTDRDLLDLEDSLLGQEELTKTILDKRRVARSVGRPETPVSKRPGEFHDAIARATHNTQVVEAVYRARAELFLAVHGLVQYDALQDSIPEHRRIFEAIKARDPGEAVNAMVAHIDNQNSLMRDLLEGTRTDGEEESARAGVAGPARAASSTSRS